MRFLGFISHRLHKLTVMILLAVTIFTVSSCCIHEWPDEVPVDVMLKLDLDTQEWPLYKTVGYDVRSNGSESYMMRYTVEAYKVLADGSISDEPSGRWVDFGESYVSEYNLSVQITAGRYYFAVWADYMCPDDNTTFYDATVLSDVPLDCSLGGNSDYKDAFCGKTEVEIIRKKLGDIAVVPVRLERPIAKVEFLSDDLKEFVTRILEVRGGAESSPGAYDTTIDFSNYVVLFHYTGFFPSAFNALDGTLSDVSTGVSFRSSITPYSDGEASLGFDYVLVNGIEGSVMMSVELRDVSGEILSSSASIEVPLKRGHLTIVRGRFLTQDTSGGVGIDPGFNGDFNISLD